MLRIQRTLIGFLVLTGLAMPARSALDDPAMKTRISKLSNGLTVLTLEEASRPVVSLQIWVRVGSRDETRYSGLAHLFEHMMFRGTDRLPPEYHARLLEGRGGRVNAFTSRDVTVYFEDVPPDALPLAIELEAERFAHLRIVEETLASERQVVLEERRMRIEDRPQGRGFEALLALAFQAHPYRRPVIGWRSDVERATVDVCRAFFRSYYAPNNLVVVIAGSFDQDETLEHLERTFGRMEPSKIERNPTEEPEQVGERRAEVHFDVRGPILSVAWHAPPAGSDEAEALDVAGQILSAGRSSRLYQRLVRKEEQALFAEGAYWEMVDAGLFYAYAGVRPDASIDRTEAALFDEIERLRDEPPSEEEVAKARLQIETALISGLTTTHALASRVARDYIVLGRIRPLEERLERIRAVTPEDVRGVARTYLRDDQRSVVRVLPAPDATEAP